MIAQYVLLLLTVVLGAIAGGVAIGCRTIRDWSWMVVLGVLIFLGAAALFSVVNPRLPGNIPSRSSRIPGAPDAESSVVCA
jgi:protein-S-isoprenylcysteine O-methyltransferase Ste14